MIVNQFTSKPILTTLDQLAMSEIKFYLTGSRFFGNYKAASDYDFFALNSPATIKFLESCDFETVKEYANYSQTIVKGLYVSNSHELIHVQLYDDPELRNTLQIKLKEIGFPWKLAKAWQKLFFEQALTWLANGNH